MLPAVPWPVAGDTGVIAQNVQPAHGIYLASQVLHRFGIGDVNGNGQHLAAQPCQAIPCHFQLRSGQITQHDTHAFTLEGARHG
ncbi:hypothetical protein D3C80_1977880 [compost metagenome]